MRNSPIGNFILRVRLHNWYLVVVVASKTWASMSNSASRHDNFVSSVFTDGYDTMIITWKCWLCETRGKIVLNSVHICSCSCSCRKAHVSFFHRQTVVWSLYPILPTVEICLSFQITPLMNCVNLMTRNWTPVFMCLSHSFFLGNMISTKCFSHRI